MPMTIRFKETNQDGIFIWQHVEAAGVNLLRGASHAEFKRGSWAVFTSPPLVLTHNRLMTDLEIEASEEEIVAIVAGSVPRRIIIAVNTLTKATPTERLYSQGAYMREDA